MRTWLYTIALTCMLGISSSVFAAGPAFDELDQNKDGKLSEAEAAAVKTLDFAKADTNGDGSLDRSEYQAAMG